MQSSVVHTTCKYSVKLFVIFLLLRSQYTWWFKYDTLIRFREVLETKKKKIIIENVYKYLNTSYITSKVKRIRTYHIMLLYISTIYTVCAMCIQDYDYYGVHKKLNVPDSVYNTLSCPYIRIVLDQWFRHNE